MQKFSASSLTIPWRLYARQNLSEANSTHVPGWLTHQLGALPKPLRLIIGLLCILLGVVMLAFGTSSLQWMNQWRFRPKLRYHSNERPQTSSLGGGFGGIIFGCCAVSILAIIIILAWVSHVHDPTLNHWGLFAILICASMVGGGLAGHFEVIARSFIAVNGGTSFTLLGLTFLPLPSLLFRVLAWVIVLFISLLFCFWTTGTPFHLFFLTSISGSTLVVMGVDLFWHVGFLDLLGFLVSTNGVPIHGFIGIGLDPDHLLVVNQRSLAWRAVTVGWWLLTLLGTAFQYIYYTEKNEREEENEEEESTLYQLPAENQVDSNYISSTPSESYIQERGRRVFQWNSRFFDKLSSKFSRSAFPGTFHNKYNEFPDTINQYRHHQSKPRGDGKQWMEDGGDSRNRAAISQEENSFRMDEVDSSPAHFQNAQIVTEGEDEEKDENEGFVDNNEVSERIESTNGEKTSSVTAGETKGQHLFEKRAEENNPNVVFPQTPAVRSEVHDEAKVTGTAMAVNKRYNYPTVSDPYDEERRSDDLEEDRGARLPAVYESSSMKVGSDRKPWIGSKVKGFLSGGPLAPSSSSSSSSLPAAYRANRPVSALTSASASFPIFDQSILNASTPFLDRFAQKDPESEKQATRLRSSRPRSLESLNSIRRFNSIHSGKSWDEWWEQVVQKT